MQSADDSQDASASKQDAVTQAAQMALKFYMKSEAGGSGGSGGGNSSALGGMLNMASKFMK
jgi:hypothetical protein